MALRIPILSYENLRVVSKNFLSKYNAEGSIRVPIEHIAEFSFGINLIPIPGLLRLYELDAFISNNLKSIMVDFDILESRSPNRYRFSLAHELAHAVLYARRFTLSFSSAAFAAEEQVGEQNGPDFRRWFTDIENSIRSRLPRAFQSEARLQPRWPWGLVIFRC